MLLALGTVDAVEAIAGVEMLTSPFMEGRTVEYVLDFDGYDGTVVIEGSNDGGDNWTALVTQAEATPTAATKRGTVLLSRLMRVNGTAWTAGAASAWLRAGP